MSIGLWGRASRRVPSAAALLCLSACASFGLPGDETPLTGTSRNLAPVPMQPAWRKVLSPGDIYQANPKERASAAYDAQRGRVCIGSHSGFFGCMRAGDGHELWVERISGSVSGRAIFDQGGLIAGTDEGELIAFDPDTGERRWTYKVQGAVVQAPSPAGGLIYFVDGTNAVYALDRFTGKWKWQYRRDPPAEFALAGEGRPTVSNGRVHVGFSDGVLVTLDAKDGAVLWTRDLAPEHDRFQDVDAAAVVVDGRLYAASAAAGLYAMDPATGKVKWSVPMAGVVALQGYEGDLLASLDSGSLIRVDTQTGKLRWRTRFGSDAGAPGEPVAVAGLVTVALSKGGLMFVDGRTGRPIQRFDPGSGFYATPTVGEDASLYVLSNGGVLYALRKR